MTCWETKSLKVRSTDKLRKAAFNFDITMKQLPASMCIFHPRIFGDELLTLQQLAKQELKTSTPTSKCL